MLRSNISNLSCVQLLHQNILCIFTLYSRFILDLAPLRQFINKLFLRSKPTRRQHVTQTTSLCCDLREEGDMQRLKRPLFLSLVTQMELCELCSQRENIQSCQICYSEFLSFFSFLFYFSFILIKSVF